MARYIKDFQINVDPQTAHSAVNQYLQKEGYEYINYDGENVFKKGQGVWSNPTFFKFSYAGNMVRMETWMKYAFFPGVYVGELGVTGFVGSAMKGPWKKRISYLENMFSSMAAQTTYYPPAPAQSTNTISDDNETQLLNENDAFEATCILTENKAGATSEKTAFCTSCGAQMPDGTLFCSVCGQKREVVQSAPSNNTYVQEQQPQPQYTNPFDAQATATYPPAGQYVSRKEFIEKYVQPSLRKNIKSISILCYVCAGLTFLMSIAVNPYGIIDALVLLGFALGMHIAKSRVCAILILILSILEVILSLIVGAFPFWWLIAGISAVITFNKIEKQYKEFLKR